MKAFVVVKCSHQTVSSGKKSKCSKKGAAEMFSELFHKYGNKVTYIKKQKISKELFLIAS